jgi:hypothetical protein
MKYKILCMRKDTLEKYYAYNGALWSDKAMAEATVRDCEKQWGDKVSFTVCATPIIDVAGNQ